MTLRVVILYTRSQMIEYRKLSDSELISMCLAHDADAWEALIRRYQRLIISIALNCGLNSEDALDVFQSVSVILLQKLQTLREQEKVGPWLSMIAKHESWHLKRKAGRLNLLEEQEWEQIAESTEAARPEPDQAYYKIERQHMIRRAEEQLSTQCRRLLALLFSETDSPSYVEIGRVLAIPISSIGPTRARCLTKMKGILAQLGFCESDL